MLYDLTTHITLKQRMDIIENSLPEEIHISLGHIGTHLDSYCQTDIPLEYFKSNGRVFTVIDKEEIFSQDIAFHKVEPEDFVIFHTGHIEKFGYGEIGYTHPHPYLSKELISKLIEKNVRFIAIDSPGIRPKQEHTPADIQCEEAGVYVVENICNIDKIKDAENITIFCAWISEKPMSGLKCRVIAEI